MARSTVLRLPQTVDFDPKNLEHVKALTSIVLKGKQHPTLRFNVRPPFESAVEMAKHLVLVQYASDLFGVPIKDELFTERFIEDSRKAEASLSNFEGSNLVSMDRRPSNVLSAVFSQSLNKA